MALTPCALLLLPPAHSCDMPEHCSRHMVSGSVCMLREAFFPGRPHNQDCKRSKGAAGAAVCPEHS